MMPTIANFGTSRNVSMVVPPGPPSGSSYEVEWEVGYYPPGSTVLIPYQDRVSMGGKGREREGRDATAASSAVPFPVPLRTLLLTSPLHTPSLLPPSEAPSLGGSLPPLSLLFFFR